MNSTYLLNARMCGALRWMVFALTGFLLSGCLPDESLSDLRSFTRDAYKDKVPEVESLPAMEVPGLQPQEVVPSRDQRETTSA